MPTRYFLIAGTFALSVLLYVDRACISAAKSDIASDLQLTDQQMGNVFAAFALGYALCQIPTGRMADRYGPRRTLAAIVALWSVFTGLTGAAFNYLTLLSTRLFFGAGEAGAFPSLARVTYSWIPMAERGIVQGINFSGSRLGGAIAFPLLAELIVLVGWRNSFFLLMLVGFAWAIFWWIWFRDDPTEHSKIKQQELDFILAQRQQQGQTESTAQKLRLGSLIRSPQIWLLCLQYFASNFTFYFALTWFLPYFKSTSNLEPRTAAWYAAAPLLAGALGNWFSGWSVDKLYRIVGLASSRRIPAVIGFCLAAIGLIGTSQADSPLAIIAWFSLAIFGADMTLAPSWAFSIDVGGPNAGLVSGTMNMAGNVGSFVTSLAFPYLAAWAGSNEPFFFLAALLNGVAVIAWMCLDARQTIRRSE